MWHLLRLVIGLIVSRVSLPVCCRIQNEVLQNKIISTVYTEKTPQTSRWLMELSGDGRGGLLPPMNWNLNLGASLFSIVENCLLPMPMSLKATAPSRDQLHLQQLVIRRSQTNSTSVQTHGRCSLLGSDSVLSIYTL